MRRKVQAAAASEALTVYQARREKVYDWMAREGIGLLMIEDTEGRRDPSLRWLCGMPFDALLFLSAARHSFLVPWDYNLAAAFGDAEHCVPYGEFQRRCVKAMQGAAILFKLPAGSKVELPAAVPYPLFLDYVGAMADFDIICRREGAAAFLGELRAVKDEAEIAVYRKAAAITNDIINLIEKHVRSGKLKTETDAALFIEAECRRYGCEGTGFGTLAAGPERSFAIHAFPGYTAAPFAAKGLSILDFGLKYCGYTTDVTMTFARGTTAAQDKLVTLVEKAYKLALSMAKTGEAARSAAIGVEALFARSKMSGAELRMPHALGHGIGLEEHEYPSINTREENGWVFAPGMVFTLEPGLYDIKLGGCRLENDFLITADGVETLTESRIVRL